MVENKSYGISKSWRIDSRFYLVEINERFYLIDYSNPKDFRNYLVPFFPEIISSWTAYDVTQDKESFTEGKIWRKFKYFKQMIFCFFVFFIINTMLFPIDLRLNQLTTDTELAKNWIPILFYILFGFFIIIFILISLTNKVPNLEEYSSFKLQKENTETTSPKIIVILRGIILSVIAYPTLLVIGIGGNNYIQLLLFGFIGIYCLIFIKFIEFQPTMGRQRIYLKEK
ncbi:hypothetical protein [Streptococcus merionis]|uniref:hypothetical protein n=1 Tax=Streptococcus merionis TaxID=400065 RepID=UPI003518DD8A